MTAFTREDYKDAARIAAKTAIAIVGVFWFMPVIVPRYGLDPYHLSPAHYALLVVWAKRAVWGWLGLLFFGTLYYLAEHIENENRRQWAKEGVASAGLITIGLLLAKFVTSKFATIYDTLPGWAQRLGVVALIIVWTVYGYKMYQLYAERKKEQKHKKA